MGWGGVGGTGAPQEEVTLERSIENSRTHHLVRLHLPANRLCPLGLPPTHGVRHLLGLV